MLNNETVYQSSVTVWWRICALSTEQIFGGEKQENTMKGDPVLCLCFQLFITPWKK